MVPIGDRREPGGRFETGQLRCLIADQSATISALALWFESCPLTSTPLLSRQLLRDHHPCHSRLLVSFLIRRAFYVEIRFNARKYLG